MRERNIPSNKCWICGFIYPFGDAWCWRCEFNKRTGIWFDGRKKEHLKLLEESDISYLIKIGKLKKEKFANVVKDTNQESNNSQQTPQLHSYGEKEKGRKVSEKVVASRIGENGLPDADNNFAKQKEGEKNEQKRNNKRRI